MRQRQYLQTIFIPTDCGLQKKDVKGGNVGKHVNCDEFEVYSVEAHRKFGRSLFVLCLKLMKVVARYLGS